MSAAAERPSDVARQGGQPGGAPRASGTRGMAEAVTCGPLNPTLREGGNTPP